MENNKVIIAHLMADEKFVDSVISLFDSVDFIENIYYFKLSKRKKKLTKHENRFIAKFSFSEIIDEIIEMNVSVLFLHSKCNIPTRLILKIPRNIKIFWRTFGYDIYSDTSFLPFDRFPVRMKLYRPHTREYILMKFPYYFLRKIYAFYENFIMYPRFMERVDYVSTVLSNELFLLKKCPFIQAELVDFRPVANIKRVNNEKDFNLDSDCLKILLGNSAVPTNNHLDILDVIKHFSFAPQDKIYLPLSYGSVSYRNNLIKYGEKSTLNLNYLIDFIPYPEYVATIEQCSVGIFGHMRQQAIGNIKKLLINGAKVFLYKDSVTYKYYKEIGISVFSIEDELTYDNMKTPLDTESRRKNIDLIRESYSFDLAKRKLESFLNEFIIE